MTTYVLMVWLALLSGGVSTGMARVDEYRTMEACEAAGRAWQRMMSSARRDAWIVDWGCLPGEQ